MQTIYERAVSAGIKYGRGNDCGMDSHGSDLYLKDTPQAREIVAAWQNESGRDGFVTYFRNDGVQWLEIPFAYDPYFRITGDQSAIMAARPRRTT
jgi:hypothetical protein